MPAYFQMFFKDDTEQQNPVKFSVVDDMMCYHFGVEPDKENYFRMWYDIEGFSMAMGKSFNEQRELYPERVHIIDWLDNNFIFDSWTSR